MNGLVTCPVSKVLQVSQITSILKVALWARENLDRVLVILKVKRGSGSTISSLE